MFNSIPTFGPVYVPKMTPGQAMPGPLSSNVPSPVGAAVADVRSTSSVIDIRHRVARFAEFHEFEQSGSNVDQHEQAHSSAASPVVLADDRATPPDGREDAPTATVEMAMPTTIDMEEAPTSLTDDMLTAEEMRRLVSDIDFIERLAMAYNYDLATTIELVLSAISKGDDATCASDLHELAGKQAEILRRNDIDTPEQLCEMLRSVQKLDWIIAGLHGFASGIGFNATSAALNFGGSAAIAGLLSEEEELTYAQTAAQGALSGLALSVASVTAGVAVEKTFRNAYYTRPPADELPAWAQETRESNKPPVRQSCKAMGEDFVKTYGGRNLARFLISQVAGFAGLRPDLVKLTDDILDPVGGAVAGTCFKPLSNRFDEKHGMSGLPYFLSRKDFEDCLIALHLSPVQKAKNMGLNTLKYIGNSITELPRGLISNVTKTEGWISAALLGAGFAGVSTAATAVARSASGTPANTDGTKFAALGGLYYLYGTAMAAAERYDTGPAADAETLDRNDIEMQTRSIRRRHPAVQGREAQARSMNQP